MSRVRSPAYPALSLPAAIDMIRKVYLAQQKTAEPREVVFLHMGYAGRSGRSEKSISALIKYGFLEKSSDGNYKVSDRAVSILYPDSEDPSSEHTSLKAAALEPDLYRKIFDRWDSRPSESSLEAFLIREGFNVKYVDKVARSFYETYDLVSRIDVSYDSPYENEPFEEEEGEEMPEGEVTQNLKASTSAFAETLKHVPSAANHSGALNVTKPIFDFETVKVQTVIDNQDDLAELISRLEQIKVMLPSKREN